ncbi:MAG: MFS transporter [Candidatus Abyssobacteria bacterium SURF_17]|uniref:MFS transporter n=1 Tax=Candidatus Abyssobacteria bacterium SURF_17 TaxID=2093361 RepID=A0A419F9E2_9BACT|nr:MAG: MFS transporter [Candidatus Abyssubacteria bacterium SURF_17]
MSERSGGIFYGWFIVGASFVTLFVTTGVGFYTFSVFMIPLENAFEASRTVITGFNSVMALIAGFATPLIGVLLHRWGARIVIGAGGLVTGAAYIALSRSTEVWHLYVLSFLLGTGLSASTLIPNQTLISHWFVKRRGTAMGMMMIGVAFGGIMFAPLAQYLIKMVGWRGAYLTFGLVIIAVVTPLAFFVIRRSPESMGLRPDGEAVTRAEGESIFASVEAGWAGLTVPQTVRTASFWCLFLLNFFMIMGTSIVTAHVVGMVKASSLGALKGEVAAGLIGASAISYFLLVSIIGRILGGYFAERLHKRFVLCALYALLAASAIVLFKLDSMGVLGVFVFLYGMGMGGSAVVYPLLVAENFGLLSFSKILGIMGIPFTIGAAIGQVGAAKIFDLTQSYATVFITLVCVFAICCVLALFAKPPKHGPA